MSYEIKRVTRQSACDKHGEYAERGLQFFDGDETWYGCDICSKEKEERKRKENELLQEKHERERAESLKRRMLEKANIPARYKGVSFKDYITDSQQQEDKKSFVQKYVDEFEQALSNGKSMIFCGSLGTGKSMLACCVINEVIERYGKSALFTTTIKAVRSVKDTYRKASEISEQEAIDAFLCYDLLVFDEVGVQFGSEAEKLILFEIINERYQQNKPTILISNLALPSLTGYIGERVIDRMADCGGGILVFDWKSKRRTD